MVCRTTDRIPASANNTTDFRPDTSRSAGDRLPALWLAVSSATLPTVHAAARTICSKATSGHCSARIPTRTCGECDTRTDETGLLHCSSHICLLVLLLSNRNLCHLLCYPCQPTACRRKHHGGSDDVSESEEPRDCEYCHRGHFNHLLVHHACSSEQILATSFMAYRQV